MGTADSFRSRFARPEGHLLGPVPGEGDLQRVLGVRMMGACRNPFEGGAARKGALLDATMWWVSVQPSFHAWSELGFVRTRRDGATVGFRLGMVVGGCASADAVADFESLDEPSFGSLELWPKNDGGGLMLDGCSYAVTFAQLGSTTTVRFQPVTEIYRRWPRQFWALAELLQRKTSNETLGEYLEVWRSYLP